MNDQELTLFNIRIDPNTKRRLIQLAEFNRRTMSDQFRWMIDRDWIRTFGNHQPVVASTEGERVQE